MPLRIVIGHLLFGAYRAVPEKRKVSRQREIKNILVIRTAYIGDVVMTLPILKPLRELYPGREDILFDGNGRRGGAEEQPLCGRDDRVTIPSGSTRPRWGVSGSS